MSDPLTTHHEFLLLLLFKKNLSLEGFWCRVTVDEGSQVTILFQLQKTDLCANLHDLFKKETPT